MIIFILLFVIPLEASFIQVIFMNPGRLKDEIEKRGVDLISNYEQCRVCGLPKPPRCHHCSKCGYCILNMDHHCDALGTCLGVRNYKLFILILFYGALSCFAGVIVTFISIFITENISKVSQTFITIFLIVLGIGLYSFQKIYIDLSINGSSTIENMFPEMKQNNKNYIKLDNLMGKGFMKYIPIRSDINPFEFTLLNEDSESL